MVSLRTILASLGNTGAIGNAQRELEQREREAWLIAGLEARHALEAPAASPAGTTRARRAA